MAEQAERIAKLNHKQAIIIAAITAATSIFGTLASSGIFKSEEGENKGSTQSDCTVAEKEASDLRGQLDASVSTSTLSAMSAAYFPRAITRSQAEDSVKALLADVSDFKEQQSHYTYKLFLIKKIMLNKPRRNINTRIDDDAASTYRIIQQILKELEYYDGAVDGERMKTYLALKKFQERVNENTPGYFAEENYGIFGNATLVAVRSLHESGS